MKCDSTKIKSGDYFSRHSHGMIVGRNQSNPNFFLVRNEDGFEWSVDSNILEKEFVIDGQYETTEKKSLTEIQELFKSSRGVAMTVNFNKQVDPKHVVNEVVELYPNNGGISSKESFKKDVTKILKEALKGSERTMRGLHFGSQKDDGRILFTDLEVKMNPENNDSGFRYVDPRTINWVIIENVMYKVKK